MNRRKNCRLQKTIKVFATSAILTTTLFTPIMSNNLDVHAETAQTATQFEQREFDLPGTGSFGMKQKEKKEVSKKIICQQAYM
ncbi:O-GlcNAcase NagJ [Bacillus thuringiensis]|uniref:O-GlcNAcase NagJ n=1 Tax=Bacillus thuringiensis TaxID=1428 RepID=A0A9W3S9J6_BACTU|nr:O-GlcNAcase NagJ [Bacillus thuringiensis]